MNVIIVGGGQVGGYIAGLLIENGNNAIVIENKEKALQALKKNGLKKENVLTYFTSEHFPVFMALDKLRKNKLSFA